MPRNQGTSRKGKPKKNDRQAGMGRALQKAQPHKHKSKPSKGGMAMTPGVDSINIHQEETRASVLEMNDLDDFLLQAEMANREFVSEKEQLVILDPTTTAATSNSFDDSNENKNRTISFADDPKSVPKNFAFQELSVPRRPKWDETTTKQQLDTLEKESFLEWRRTIAKKEEQIILESNSGLNPLGVTPFEKNLEIWRQLWRVMERCSCIVQIVDARNPLFYLSKDLKQYATKELGKPMVLCINKSDYLTSAQRQAWNDYFNHPDHQWDHIFFSAHEQQQVLDEQAAEEAAYEDAMTKQPPPIDLTDEDKDNNAAEEEDDNVTKEETQPAEAVLSTAISNLDNVGVEQPLSRDDMLDWLHLYADRHNCSKDTQHERIPFGMVGFPNVGKSSVINVLMGNSRNAHGVVRVGVAAQPGKTKHFQTLLLPEPRNELLLCDCPGLVFPSFVNNTADLIAAGVFPISQMRDSWPVVNLLCQRIPRQILNAQYGIQIPLPTSDAVLSQQQNVDDRGEVVLPPPTAEEFLSAYCHARGWFAAASGVPDHPRAARTVIKDYASGKLLYCHAPPNVTDMKTFQNETLIHALQNTEKLRDKILNQQQQQSNDEESNVDDAEENGNDDDEDMLMLELMGEETTNTKTALNTAGNTGVTSNRKKKWGRKGRKGRNKDPYGCHSTPDDMLVANSGAGVSMKAPNGVTVKAGKYSKKGYTRPTAYGSSTRSAA